MNQACLLMREGGRGGRKEGRKEVGRRRYQA